MDEVIATYRKSVPKVLGWTVAAAMLTTLSARSLRDRGDRQFASSR